MARQRARTAQRHRARDNPGPGRCDRAGAPAGARRRGAGGDARPRPDDCARHDRGRGRAEADHGHARFRRRQQDARCRDARHQPEDPSQQAQSIQRRGCEGRLMRLSLKQKQVLGVTAMVALIVIALSLLHLMTLARVLLLESRDRLELLANEVYVQAREVVSDPSTAYDALGGSRSVQSALEAAIYSQDVIDAVIVDPTGTVIASSDPLQVGTVLSPRTPLNNLFASSRLAQLQAVYNTEQSLEWNQPIALGDQPFGEIRIGLSTILVRSDLNESLAPAVAAAGGALVV